jgi:hypothetical protein
MADAETKGIAIVGLVFGQAALSLLNSKGVISAEERDLMLEGILTGIETLLPIDDPGVQVARKLVERIATINQRDP